MRKSFIKVLSVTVAFCMLIPSTVFAGQWKKEGSTWKYQKDDGTYTSGTWQWIDGKSYCFDSNGNMYANTTTPDGYTVNENGQWTVNGVVQTQNANNATTTSDEFPLKGRVEKYFGVEDGNLVPYWQPAHVISEGVVPAGMTGMTYIDIKAVEDKDISYHNPQGGYNLAVLAILAGYDGANIPYKDAPETQQLLSEVKAFMNSFDWRNASDLEKATRICNRIHQASYDYDAANEAQTTGWSESPSYGAYGCLVNGKAVCQGYTEAANLLGYAVGIKTFEMGDVGHTYPVFLVDGIWLGNEPTTQNKYFLVEDVYRKNVLGTYQQLGQYCEATGYTIPTDLSQLPDWAGKQEETRFGKQEMVIYFR